MPRIVTSFAHRKQACAGGAHTLMTRVQQRNGSVVVAEVEAKRNSASAPEVAESPLYGVAMLKIAMELKKPGARELDEILTGVLARMRIPEEEFRQFLAQNGGLLRTIAQKKGY